MKAKVKKVKPPVKINVKKFIDKIYERSGAGLSKLAHE